MQYLGMEIIESNYVPEKEPVIKLREDTPMTPEFREKCNQRYIEMFGYKSVVYMVSGKIIMHPKNATILKIAVRDTNPRG